MIKFYGLIAICGFLVFCISILIGSGVVEKNRRRRIHSAFENECDPEAAGHAPEIKEMVTLYLTMAAKHGPDSEEAKAFRFGTGSSLMQRLHGDDAAMKAFNRQADVIDEVCRRMMKKKKR